MREPRLERAIGVIYRPETERASHYFQARLPDQFDAVLHFDETRAVEPLERTAGWERGRGAGDVPLRGVSHGDIHEASSQKGDWCKLGPAPCPSRAI